VLVRPHRDSSNPRVTVERSVWCFRAQPAYPSRAPQYIRAQTKVAAVEICLKPTNQEGAWTLARGNAEGADLVVETTLETWGQFLTARGARKLPRDDIRLVGRAAAVKEFAKAFAAELRSR
jgi:hypothetical protein